MRRRGGKRDELSRDERRRFEDLVHAYYELDAVDLRRSTGSHVIAVPAEGTTGAARTDAHRIGRLRWRRRR
jgi:hypothetical protein